MSGILEGLNAKQQEAVTAIDGNIRVTAGAGSGKTRVLAHRYAFLVNEVGISPANILCMTFTNKAAQEMKNRIKTMVHQGNVNDFVCTIHGFCVKFLREEIFRLGYPKNFAIIDEEDAKDLAKQVMEELNIAKSVQTVKQFLTNIHKNKTTGGYVGNYMLPSAIIDNKKEFERYLQLQVKLFALDFEDLIQFTLYILEKYDNVRTKWQERLNYLMVDEAQDCNGSEWTIVENLVGNHHNLFIVGDPDQCIYEWRGAMPKYFIDFAPDKDIILEQNYRSTPNILDVANSIISHNEVRIEKNLFTEKVSDKIVLHYHGKSEQEESNWIATQIDNMVKAGAKYSDFAVLYRAQWISRFIEETLLHKQIPYTIWGGIRFFERKEVKDALAYLRLLVYPQDDLSFRRIINVPSRKFGKTSMQKLTILAEQDNSNLFSTLQQNIYLFTNNRAVNDFISLYSQANLYKNYHSISDTLDFLLKRSGYKDALRLDGDEERAENLEELFSSIKYYEDINKNEEESNIVNYLQNIALYTNADYKKDTPTVKLMTIHQAKGLEFPYVFVCGLTEGIFPSHKTIRYRKLNGLEEERRLMYVAVTRAEKALFLTESEGFNRTTQMAKYPSRFLMEIKDDLVQVEGNIDPELLEGTKKTIAQENLTSLSTSVKFNPGDKVSHKYFGEGEVVSYDAEAQSYKVRFGNNIKMLSEKFLSQAPKVISHQDQMDKEKEWYVLAKDETGEVIQLDVCHTKAEALKEVNKFLPAPEGTTVFVSDHFNKKSDNEDDLVGRNNMETFEIQEVHDAKEMPKGSLSYTFNISEKDKSINGISESKKHIKFKDISIEGKARNVINNLKKKGYTEIKPYSNSEHVGLLQGDFAGICDILVCVMGTSISNTAFAICVNFQKSYDWYSLKSQYLILKEMLSQEYGSPISQEEFLFPFSEGEGFEIAALMTNSYKYISLFTIEYGKVILSINSDCSVFISYMDDQGTELDENEKDVMPDFNL